MIATTEQAMEVLHATKGHYIAIAREIAVELAKSDPNLEVDSRRVILAMEERGLIGEEGNRFWSGAVFNRNPAFVKTGKRRSYSSGARNIHEREIAIWRYVGAP